MPEQISSGTTCDQPHWFFIWLPLRFSAGLFYAPDVATFGQADRIFDANFNVGVPLRDRLSAFVGLRYLKIDTLTGGTPLIMVSTWDSGGLSGIVKRLSKIIPSISLRQVVFAG